MKVTSTGYGIKDNETHSCRNYSSYNWRCNLENCKEIS